MSQLDDVLRDWADRSEPDAASLDALRQRIREQVLSENLNVVVTHEASLRPSHRTELRGSWVCGVALVCVLTVAVFLGRGSKALKNSLPDFVGDEHPVPDLLLSELDRMFEGHWRWLGEVNGRSHLETSDGSTVESPDDRPQRVAVRLTVVERRHGETRWRVVWDASVLARSEERVQLPSSLIGNSSVSLWAYALPDGSVMVESDVALSGPVNVELATERLFPHDGHAVELWAEQQGDREVRLLESTASTMRRPT